MCTATHTCLAVSGLQRGVGSGGGVLREMELLLWMGPHQRKWAETVISTELKWSTPLPCSNAGLSLRAGAAASQCNANVELGPFPHSVCHNLPPLWWVDMTTWQWSIQRLRAPSSTVHTLSPPQHGSATLPESTNEGLVRARTTIPQRLWWGGREGGSSLASLWFLPTALLLVQSVPDRTTVTVTHNMERLKRTVQRADVFLYWQIVFVISLPWRYILCHGSSKSPKYLT